MRPFALLACCSLALFAACQGGPDADGDVSVEDSTGSEPADSAAVEEVPNRTTDAVRDAGEKPADVMDFLSVDAGDQVADLFAGGGYYTYWLSQRVGADGTVYAQGASPGLAARAVEGDLATATNITLVDSLSGLPTAALDAVLINRGYHLFEDPAELLTALDRALAPGGVVGIIEVRLGAPEGHDMETHRMGEETIISQFEAAGFTFVEASELLKNPADDHTEFWEGRRHEADRMLLKFTKS